MKEENTKVVLIGAENEKHLVEEVAYLMEESPILAIGLKLTQLVSLIKKCSLFIGNSTGPMHIVSALNVPVVAIFGSQHPLDSYQEWGPWGEGHIVVSKDLNCPECHPSDCITFNCMKLISVQDVFVAVQKQLKNHNVI